MKLFHKFKKQPRLLEHGQAGDMATASEVPTPTASDVPTVGEMLTASNIPAVTSTPNTSSHPIGAEILVQGALPITADVVFVHGLHGHRRDTWTKDNICWPQDLLSKERALEHIRIVTLGYDANIVNLNGRASLNTLFQHSINLVQELSRVRKDAPNRPIIFVTHSLGGLLVKDALHYSYQVQDTHPHLATIFSVTRGIVFLGTPHRGSGMTSIAKVVASVARMALKNPHINLIRDLERDSQTLDRIGDSFGRILDKQTLTIWSFSEELEMSGIGKVVPGDSAVIGDPRENRGTIHGDHISMVKFSTKDDPGYKKVLYSIEMLLEELEDDSLTASEQNAVQREEVKTFYSIPPLRVPHFISRETLYSRLQILFDGAVTTSTPLIVVLIGMGGAGKTQLALEYCRRMKEPRRFRAIFWLDASSHNTLYSSMETVAQQLLPDRVLGNPDTAVALVKDVLSSWSERWLLVFDNLDNPEDLPGIFKFFPASHHGFILITSRLTCSKELGKSLGLDRMEEEEGLQLLLRPSEENFDELGAAKDALGLLGNLPLAIEQARAYISKRQLRLSAFVGEYERRKESVTQETPHFWQYWRMLPGEEKETSLSLLTTWEMSLPLLDVGEQAAKFEKVLTLFAFFNAVNISERLFSIDADDDGLTTSPMSIFKDDGHWNHLKFEDALVKMQELSLLQFSQCNESEITISLHSMVSEWLRMRLDKGSHPIFLNSAVSHLKCHLESIGDSDHKIRQEGIVHLDTIWRGVESSNLGDDFLEARITFGNFYHKQGRHKDAEMMFNCALASYEKALGPEHTSTLNTINNLGSLYADQRLIKDAGIMYKRALAGYEKALGPGHITTLRTAKNLGIIYRNQGHLKEAELMCKRALAGYEKTLGPEHTSTLETINCLGALYTDQGLLKDAETMFRRALTGFEKALGPEHTSTLKTVNNLGILYQIHGHLKEAELMCKRALAGYEKALGPEHTSTLKTVDILGGIYRIQGHLKEAELMCKRALAGYEKTLGPEHTSTFDSIYNLGIVYADQELLKDAEIMDKRALVGYEKAFGPEHTSALNVVNHLGIIYRSQGHLKKAELMCKRALAGYEKALGPEHTSTLDSIHNLGMLCADQDLLKDAEIKYNRVLAGYEKAFGPEHISTLKTINSLGLLYKNRGKLKEAESMFKRALVGYEKALGPEHTFTLDVINNLGLLYVDQGHLKEAELMYNRALAGYEKAFGLEQHTHLLNTVNNLGLLYADQGRLEESEMMYKRALAGYEKILGPEHAITLRIANNLGLLYADQGRLEESEMMYKRALAGYEKILGPEHASTLRTANGLGNLYKTRGRLQDALRMFNRR